MTPTLLQIAQLGQPILRKTATRITNPKDPGIQILIDNLIATLLDVNGVGMAAPQVYESVQLFIVASHPNPRYLNAPMMKPTPVLNPKIIRQSKESKKDWEGCLSIPGVRALVPRSTHIEVEFINRKGIKERRKFDDFIARIFLHEFDHLRGLLFLDRVESNKDIISEKEYQRIIAKKK